MEETTWLKLVTMEGLQRLLEKVKKIYQETEANILEGLMTTVVDQLFPKHMQNLQFSTPRKLILVEFQVA